MHLYKSLSCRHAPRILIEINIWLFHILLHLRFGGEAKAGGILGSKPRLLPSSKIVAFGIELQYFVHVIRIF